jgi:hypothetical protein
MPLKIFTNGEVLFDTDLNGNFAFLNDTKLNSLNPQLGTFTENVETLGNAPASLTVQLDAAPLQTLTITQETTVSFAGQPSESGQARSALLLIAQDSTGGHVVNWPSSIAWFGAVEPSEWPADEILALTIIATSSAVYAFAAEQIPTA